MHALIEDVAAEVAAVVGEALTDVEFADLVERVAADRMVPSFA